METWPKWLMVLLETVAQNVICAREIARYSSKEREIEDERTAAWAACGVLGRVVSVSTSDVRWAMSRAYDDLFRAAEYVSASEMASVAWRRLTQAEHLGHLRWLVEMTDTAPGVAA